MKRYYTRACDFYYGNESKSLVKNKVIVVFQPHRYTRTKILIREFIKVLSKVDYLFLLETFLLFAIPPSYTF